MGHKKPVILTAADTSGSDTEYDDARECTNDTKKTIAAAAIWAERARKQAAVQEYIATNGTPNQRAAASRKDGFDVVEDPNEFVMVSRCKK